MDANIIHPPAATLAEDEALPLGIASDETCGIAGVLWEDPGRENYDLTWSPQLKDAD